MFSIGSRPMSAFGISQTIPLMCSKSTSGLSFAITEPLFKMIRLSVIVSMSETMCVEIIIMLVSLSFTIILLNCSRSNGSRPAEGSSKISISGELRIVCAMARRCFIPPENDFILSSRFSDRFTSPSTRLISSSISGSGIPFNRAENLRNSWAV